MTYRRLPPPSHDPGGSRGSRAYHRARSAEEYAAAGASSCMVRDVHLELAELHAEQADAEAARSEL